jgi:hypothetical protein
MLAAERRTFAFGFLIFAAALQFSLLQLVLVQARPQPQQQPPQEGEGEEAQQNTGPNELNTYGLPMDLKGISLGKVPPPTEKGLFI